MPVVPIANLGDTLVRYGWPVWPIEQAADSVHFSVDAHALPRTVAPAFRQPGQGLTNLCSPAAVPHARPRADRNQCSCHNISFAVFAQLLDIVAGPMPKSNVQDGEKERDFS